VNEKDAPKKLPRGAHINSASQQPFPTRVDVGNRCSMRVLTLGFTLFSRRARAYETSLPLCSPTLAK
jgi:hypothetical protein